MRTHFAVPLLMLALSVPAMGHDFLAPLRDMVEGITQPPAQTPRRPRPAVSEETPPIPQQRPAELGGKTPEVAVPAKPVVPEIAKPVPPEPPVVAEPEVSLPQQRPEEAEKPAEPAPAPVEATEPAPETAPPANEGVPEQAAPEPSAPAEPGRIFQTACPAVLAGQVEAEALPPISEGQCQAQSPLSLTGVMANGRMIPFNAAATVDCGMASTLPGWVSDVDNYLRGHDDTRIESVVVGTGYMCRNVNNAAEGNLSFHGFADALDVVGFKLEDGRTVTVDEAWTGTEDQGSRIVKFAHDAACGHFTTVLGPEANDLHHDHLHLDLGCHGKTCTARLCE